MLERLKLLLLFTLYWLVFMVTVRAIFLLYNHDITSQLTALEIFRVFVSGFRMDVSLSGYILMLTGILLSISTFTKSKLPYYIILATNVGFLLLACFIVIVDIELYRHWGFRLNTTPFLYISREAMDSVSSSVFIKTLSILALLFSAFSFILFRLFSNRLFNLAPGVTRAHQWRAFTIIFSLAALLIIPIRGSFSVAPMNTGFVYFHKTKSYANHAAINVVWNFAKSLSKGNAVVYPENFFDKNLSKTYFKNLYPPSDSTYVLLNTQQHTNIILIILESFTADVIEPLGGLTGITPNFSQLCKEGILFTNFYASGDRTDKGIVSILSGYPAQPQSSIIKFPAKTENLPFLSRHLNRLGYHSSFVYGGDVNFANMRSYLTNSHFDHITSADNFNQRLNKSKWGVHDQYVFKKMLEECTAEKTKFFKVMLSLSSHEPYDVPMQHFIKGNDDESLFLNSCHYTDKCLGQFIANAKQQPWWQNTLVVLVADHGHRHPHNKELKSKERFRIPMLWLGGALAKKDSTINLYASQTDIANTLLAQVDKSANEFNFSKNILGNKVQHFATYFFSDGYGFIKPNQYIIYDNVAKQFYKTEGASQKDLAISKAYQQVLFEDYNKR